MWATVENTQVGQCVVLRSAMVEVVARVDFITPDGAVGLQGTDGFVYRHQGMPIAKHADAAATMRFCSDFAKGRIPALR